MLAIGIDPGTAICGFGLVEMVGNKLTPIHYGAVFTDKDMLPELRLKKIYMVQKLLNIRTKPKPDDVADALAVAICGLHTAATRRWQELK